MRSIHRAVSILLLLCFFCNLAACSRPQVPEAPTATTAPAAPTQPYPAQKVLINTDGMTDLQKAVVITAESYYLRGKYAQYSQGKRVHGARAPEDYTEQAIGYTDCSAFVWDVYHFSLGIDICNGTVNTAYMCANPGNAVLCEEPIKNKFSSMSGAEQAAKLIEFRNTLQPGDVIVYRYADGNNGHAMLYVGGGMMIHSTGSDSKTEENGTVLYESVNSLLASKGSRSLLTKSIYLILRPLNSYKGEIPAHTQSRMNLMRGIRAEKLTSLGKEQIASPGTEITFTFRIQNRSDLDKTLTVSDTVPANTTYLSGAQTVTGNALSWTVNVPAGQTAEVAYTVRINPDAPKGSYLYTKSQISGIPVNCPVIQILGSYQP